MLLLGLLILGATGAFAGLLIAENLDGGPDYSVNMFGNELATLNTLAAFLAGMALTLAFCLGLAMVTGRVGRRRRNRVEAGPQSAAAVGRRRHRRARPRRHIFGH